MINIISLNFNKFLILFLFLFWGISFSTGIYYLLFACLSVLFFLFLLNYRIKIPFFKREDYIILSFIVIWFYGICVGLFMGNSSKYIASNFAGMVCYFMYFMLTTMKCRIEKIFKVLLLCGFFQSLMAIVIFILLILGYNNLPSFLLLTLDVGISSTGQLRVYSTLLSIVYPLLGVSLYSFLYPSNSFDMLFMNKRKVSFSLFVLTTIALLFVSSSKGFMLGGLFVIFMVVLLPDVRRFLSFKINKMIFFFFFLLIILFGVLVYFDYFSIIEMMFDASDVSNEIRYEQLDYILSDCTFWGNGLGAVIPGYVRNSSAPYGFELTYVNLIHKFGIISIFLFGGWAYLFMSLARLLIKKKNIYFSVIAFSSLGYLFPSIGNPLLMHPSLVILCCITFYYIREVENV